MNCQNKPVLAALHKIQIFLEATSPFKRTRKISNYKFKALSLSFDRPKWDSSTGRRQIIG